MTRDREYLSFDPSSCGFPPPRVPVLPLPGRHAFHWQRQTSTTALLDSPNARFFSRGRYALAHAFRLSGLGPDTALLAPAYHCRTMLDPAIALGADITLYPLHANLQPDIEALEHLLRNQSQRHAALLLPHFFGIEQTLDAVDNLCTQYGVTLIEDCSHALFLPSLPGNIGKRGRYSVASPYKFFPIEDGGILWANHGAPLPESSVDTPDLMAQCKGVARALQKACSSSADLDTPEEVGSPSPESNKPDQPPLYRRHVSNTASYQYDANADNMAGLQVSRQLMLHSDIERIALRRRGNYQKWAQAIADLPNCKALFPDLASDCVPYMFPLWIAHPEVDFFALKQLGIPVWRWDDMAVSDCSVAMQYRTQLLHLPCHQELTSNQLDWMVCLTAIVLSKSGLR
jgi:perosamine synthetase